MNWTQQQIERVDRTEKIYGSGNTSEREWFRFCTSNDSFVVNPWNCESSKVLLVHNLASQSSEKMILVYFQLRVYVYVSFLLLKKSQLLSRADTTEEY